MPKKSIINRVIISSKKNFKFGVHVFQKHRLICIDKNMEKALRQIPWEDCELHTIDGKSVNPPPKKKKPN